MGERKIPGGGWTVAVVVAAVLASCSQQAMDESRGGDRGGDRSEQQRSAPLSVAAVERMAARPGTDCPVHYDLAGAARAAGVAGAGAVEARSVEGERPDGADSPLAQAGGALVDCGYRLGEERIRLFTVAVTKGTAVNVLLPQIQHDAALSMDALLAYADRARRAKRGEPLLTSTGNVAAVRLPTAGDGDLALVLSIGKHHTRLSRDQVTKLATHLADQARSQASARGSRPPERSAG
ncbi:hypothetical protein ITI46_16265 [Streptomyces oryzae]|uniref:DUF3558 domain-containing protein n=1 Tax=Streptomyces oryzae TaxID=1434886 RepID=A0ABS3XCW2_9ACTN|nr:hypothetical protein [Streptomyces oryzae]MBO8193210.1 hypothetical protein [Streptomyces oryzae]